MTEIDSRRISGRGWGEDRDKLDGDELGMGRKSCPHAALYPGPASV